MLEAKKRLSKWGSLALIESPPILPGFTTVMVVVVCSTSLNATHTTSFSLYEFELAQNKVWLASELLHGGVGSACAESRH